MRPAGGRWGGGWAPRPDPGPWDPRGASRPPVVRANYDGWRLSASHRDWTGSLSPELEFHGNSGAEMWGKARSPGPEVSRGTPDAVHSAPPFPFPPRRAALHLPGGTTGRQQSPGTVKGLAGGSLLFLSGGWAGIRGKPGLRARSPVVSRCEFHPLDPHSRGTTRRQHRPGNCKGLAKGRRFPCFSFSCPRAWGRDLRKARSEGQESSRITEAPLPCDAGSSTPWTDTLQGHNPTSSRDASSAGSKSSGNETGLTRRRRWGGGGLPNRWSKLSGRRTADW